MRYAIIFFAMMGLDIMWAQYTAAVATKRPLRASFFSLGITGGGAVLTFAYLWNGPTMALATCAGAMVGTYISVRWGK